MGAKLQGGDFGRSALYGAMGGAIGYAIAVDLPDAIENRFFGEQRFHLFLDHPFAAAAWLFPNTVVGEAAAGFVEGWNQGLWASVDGAIPLANRLAKMGLYNPNESVLKFSQNVGGAGIQTLATLGIGEAITLPAKGAPVITPAVGNAMYGETAIGSIPFKDRLLASGHYLRVAFTTGNGAAIRFNAARAWYSLTGLGKPPAGMTNF